MLESLLLNEGVISRNETELLNRALIDKFIVIVAEEGSSLARLNFELIFLFLLDIGHGLGSLLDELEGEITL